jgi:hypothetical protein
MENSQSEDDFVAAQQVLENIKMEKEAKIRELEKLDSLKLAAKAAKDAERADELNMNSRTVERFRPYYEQVSEIDKRCVDCARAWDEAEGKGLINYNVAQSTCPKCGTVKFYGKETVGLGGNYNK